MEKEDPIPIHLVEITPTQEALTIPQIKTHSQWASMRTLTAPTAGAVAKSMGKTPKSALQFMLNIHHAIVTSTK
jgi:hypothetical protein